MIGKLFRQSLLAKGVVLLSFWSGLRNGVPARMHSPLHGAHWEHGQLARAMVPGWGGLSERAAPPPPVRLARSARPCHGGHTILKTALVQCTALYFGFIRAGRAPSPPRGKSPIDPYLGVVRRKPSDFPCIGVVGADLRAARSSQSKQTCGPPGGRALPACQSNGKFLA